MDHVILTIAHGLLEFTTMSNNRKIPKKSIYGVSTEIFKK